ncbi:hypothetical protein LG307_14665 [Sutcliffiella horikoshii]|uniref:hypothetical protein n=1 Tax=Sutcliffiella horikoshii TaxID=79883 RepID=UPI00384D5589
MLTTQVVFFDGNGQWDIAGSVLEALKMGATYIVETIEELNDLSAAGVIINENERVVTKEGVVHFYSETIVDEHGDEDCFCEYRLVG